MGDCQSLPEQGPRTSNGDNQEGNWHFYAYSFSHLRQTA